MVNVEAIAEMSKSELADRLVATAKRAHSVVQRNKVLIRRVGFVAAGSAVAAVTGLALGGIEIKMPTLPKTKIRSDLAYSAAVTAANLAGVFGDAGEIIQASAYAAEGHGFGRISEAALRKRGVK